MTSAEYMRQYRARTGGVSQRAHYLALDILKDSYPEVWLDCLKQARAELGLGTELGPSGWNFTKAIAHGTVNGDAQHRYRNEPPCDACREARNSYNRELKRRKAEQ